MFSFFLAAVILSCTLFLGSELVEEQDFPPCTEHLQQYISVRKMKLSIIRREGEKLVLPCHICTYESAVIGQRWIRSKAKFPNIDDWNANYQDLTSESRITITSAGDLHIDQLQRDDAGRYFCTSGNGSNGVGVEYMVDVEMKVNVPAPESGGFSEWFFFQARTYIRANVLFGGPKSTFAIVRAFPEWSSWSHCLECSVGDLPSRNRSAICHLKNIGDYNLSAVPTSLRKYHIYSKGVSCSSAQIFPRLSPIHQNALLIPPFLYSERCPQICHSDKKASRPTHTHKRVIRSLEKNEGDEVELHCPGTNAEAHIFWVNGTKRLRFPTVTKEQNSTARAFLDMDHVLHIASASVEDSNIYACWVNGWETISISLTVHRRPPWKSTLRHFNYVMAAMCLALLIYIGIIYLSCDRTRFGTSSTFYGLLGSHSRSEDLQKDLGKELLVDHLDMSSTEPEEEPRTSLYKNVSERDLPWNGRLTPIDKYQMIRHILSRENI